MQFTIVTKTSIHTVCMYEVMVCLTIAALLETCFTMAELLPAHTTCCTLAFVRDWLRADAPFAASSTDRASWCSNVMYCWHVWHRSIFITGSVLSLCVIVSADNGSQLNVNDGGRVKIVSCKWCLIVPSRLVLARGIRSGRLCMPVC